MLAGEQGGPDGKRGERDLGPLHMLLHVTPMPSQHGDWTPKVSIDRHRNLGGSCVKQGHRLFINSYAHADALISPKWKPVIHTLLHYVSPLSVYRGGSYTLVYSSRVHSSPWLHSPRGCAVTHSANPPINTHLFCLPLLLLFKLQM